MAKFATVTANCAGNSVYKFRINVKPYRK